MVWVVRFPRQLKPGECASQRGYDNWVRTNDSAPWSSKFSGKFGGLAKVRDAAWEGAGLARATP